MFQDPVACISKSVRQFDFEFYLDRRGEQVKTGGELNTDRRRLDSLAVDEF